MASMIETIVEAISNRKVKDRFDEGYSCGYRDAKSGRDKEIVSLKAELENVNMRLSRVAINYQTWLEAIERKFNKAIGIASSWKCECNGDCECNPAGDIAGKISDIAQDA